MEKFVYIIFLILLIFLNLIDYSSCNENITLIIKSKFVHSYVLDNGNILIIHETGVNLYNSLMTNLVGQYNFTEQNKITEVFCPTTNFFQEEETDNKYVFIIAKNIIYIFSPDNLSLKINYDLNEYLVSPQFKITYSFLLYQYLAPFYYIFISYPLEGKAILNIFKIDVSSPIISIFNPYTHRNIIDNSEKYISKYGISCQIMHSTLYGKVVICFYKTDFPKYLKAIGFQIDESNNNITEISYINSTSSQIDKTYQIIKSCISEDKKKAFICYRSAEYEGTFTYCTIFEVDNLSFEDEIKYADTCGESPDYLNVYYFKKLDEYIFICKTIGSNEEYKIIKFNNNLKKINLDINGYEQEPNLFVTECHYLFSFSLIYLSAFNNYFIIGDPIIQGSSEQIKINILPDYFISNLNETNDYSLSSQIFSSLPNINTTYQEEVQTTSISPFLDFDISSSFLSSIPTTVISTNYISSTNPIFSDIQTTSLNTFKASNIISSLLYTSSIISSSIISTSYSISSTIFSTHIHSSDFDFSTLINTTTLSSNIHSSEIYSSMIFSSDNISSSIISSNIHSSNIQPSNNIYSEIYSSSIISSDNSQLFNIYSDITSSSNISKIPLNIYSSLITTSSTINNNIDECELISKDNKKSFNDCLENFTKDLIKQIKADKNIVIKEYNEYSIYLYELETNLEDIKKNSTSLIIIDNSDLKNILIDSFGLEEKDNIYILILDYINQNINSAINNYDFIFILENGTVLNLSEIHSDIYSDISIPIKNLKISNYDYALYFSEYGYDIYDSNNSFYKNICSSAYYEDNDIVINDRKKIIFPNNISLCINNCAYKITDFESKRFICECVLNSKNDSNSSNYNFENVENNNFGIYLLDMMNYKLFNCYFLIFKFDNYKKNIGLYFLLFYIFLYIFFIMRFFIHRIRYIRILTFENLSKAPKEIMKKRISYKNFFINKGSKNSTEQTNEKLIIRNSNIYNLHPKKLNRHNKKKLRKNEKSIIKNNKLKEGNVIDNKKDEEIIYSKLPFNQAVLLDERNFVQIFNKILVEKIEIINLIINKRTRIKELLVSQYILSLLIDFFFNAFLYSDEIISKKYHNKGKLNIIITLVLSLISNIITNIICSFLDYCNEIEDIIEELMEIRQEIKLLRVLKKLMRYIIIKIIALSIFQVIIILICIYYILIFFIVYSCSQISLLINYLISFLEKIAYSVIISIIIAGMRKISFFLYNKYLYNVSKYIDEHF